jgi:hypothetical protein
MKHIITIFVFLIIQSNSFATEWNWYYIYIQTEYTQGSWLRADHLDRSDYKYLETKQFEELFGSEGDGLAEAIVNHLKHETPGRYKFKYAISVVKDTVYINTPDSIADFDAVKNELTASLIMNNFNKVTIIQKGIASSFHLEDISVPYMDLVFPEKIKPIHDTDISIQSDSIKIVDKKAKISAKKYDNKILIALIISIIGNVILAGLLLRNRKK